MTDFDRTANQHRPPLGKAHPPTGKPLIVTPTFVSRVDDTPRAERPQDSGSAKSRHGHEVHLPNWRASALALEGNPDLAFEHWDEYWRKVHGYIAYASEDDIEATLGQEKFAKRIVADEQTAFRMVTREITREHILIPSARHRDPISLVKIHMRRPELARENFQQRLLGEHAELVLAQPATKELVRRYAQLHNIGSTQNDPEGSKIDAVSILSFACMNDVEDYLIHTDHGAVQESEDAIAGDGSEWWTAVNYSIINRLAPEVATQRV